MKSISYLFSLALFLTFWSACNNGNSNTAQSETTGNTTGVTPTEIKVGSFGPMTGPAALWGNVSKGMDAYFKMINDEGGIHGRKLNLILKDDAYDPSKTVAIVRELVQKEEVFALVGGIGTAPCMSVLDYIVEEQIPWVGPMTGASHWSIPLKKNVFGLAPYYFDEVIIQVKYALDTLKKTKIGIIYQNDDVGKSALIGAKSILKGRNLDFISEVPLEVMDSDLSSHVAKLKDSGAEIVLLWNSPRQAVITITNANIINYKPQYMASSILGDMTLMHDLTKGAWEGVLYATFGVSPYDYSNTDVVKYKAVMEKYYPDIRWGSFPLAGFLYAEPFIVALKKMGPNVTRENLIAALESLNNEDMHGTILSYSPSDHQGLRTLRLLQCIGREQYRVATDFTEGDPNVAELAKEL